MRSEERRVGKEWRYWRDWSSDVCSSDLSIEAVRLQYSIPMLIKHGIGEFLRSYELRNAELVFRPGPSKTKEDTKEKKSLAEDLNNLLGQPALYADEIGRASCRERVEILA